MREGQKLPPFLKGVDYMVFVGEPNHYVVFSNEYVIRVTNQNGFKFDDKGEYETNNPLLIKYIGQHFKAKETPAIEEEKPKEIVKDTKINKAKKETKPQRKGRKQ